MNEPAKRVLWRGFSATVAAISVIVTRRVLAAAWKRFGGGPPDEADRRVTVGTALTWALSMGVGIGIARLIAMRVSARVWEAATHEAPPVTT
jgi:hypothetical protein